MNYELRNQLFQRIARYLMLHGSFMSNIGLLTGKTGIAIFFYHYARYTGRKIYSDFADELIDEIYREIHINVPLNFKDGLCGIAWGIEYLMRNGFIDGNPDEVLEDLDKRIIEWDVRRISDCSLETGLTGIACYVVSRTENKEKENSIISSDYKNNLIEALKKKKEETGLLALIEALENPGYRRTDRGYTGHEHLPEFALINMNARLYDPVLGRFLSPDPFVQAPDLSQSFNRYSYCLNNPLLFIDEDGEFWNFIIGAIIGGFVNWATHGFQFNAKGLGYFTVGALAGALGTGIGAGISSALPVAGTASGGFSVGFLGTSAATTATSSFVSGVAIGGGAGLASGFTTGFGNALVDGKNFGQALGQGGMYGLIGGVSGCIIGGVAGGIDAAIHGRRFWDGAAVTKEYATDVNVVPVKQVGNDNCLPSSGESVNKSLKGNVTQEQFRKLAGGDSNSDPLNDINFWKNTYAEKTGQTVQGYGQISGAKYIVPTLKDGGGVALTIPGSNGIEHSVVVKSVFLQIVTKINGYPMHTIMYQVMDPATGGFRNIPYSQIINIFTIKP